MTCPRRLEEFGPWEHEEGLDHWRDDHTCSFCGSLDSDLVMERIEAGEEITPTDKDYKIYIGEHNKAYFQHFSKEQRTRLVELVNDKKVKFKYPGHFYVLPFFMHVVPSGDRKEEGK